MLGLTFDKLIILGAIAVFVIGPERLPAYAAKLARLVRSLRTMADGAKGRLKDELGPDFDDIDWVKLDPRQYDPRRIIREALNDTTRDDVADNAPQRDAPKNDTPTWDDPTRANASAATAEEAPPPEAQAAPHALGSDRRT